MIPTLEEDKDDGDVKNSPKTLRVINSNRKNKYANVMNNHPPLQSPGYSLPPGEYPQEFSSSGKKLSRKVPHTKRMNTFIQNIDFSPGYEDYDEYYQDDDDDYDDDYDYDDDDDEYDDDPQDYGFVIQHKAKDEEMVLTFNPNKGKVDVKFYKEDAERKLLQRGIETKEQKGEGDGTEKDGELGQDQDDIDEDESEGNSEN